MFFTLIFNDTRNEGPTVSVDLCFHPCPVWSIGNWSIVPGDRGPHYKLGYIGELQVREGGLLSRIDSSNLVGDIMVTVVCHPNGQGTDKDLATLLEDLKSYKFATRVFPSPHDIMIRAEGKKFLEESKAKGPNYDRLGTSFVMRFKKP